MWFNAKKKDISNSEMLYLDLDIAVIGRQSYYSENFLSDCKPAIVFRLPEVVLLTQIPKIGTIPNMILPLFSHLLLFPLDTPCTTLRENVTFRDHT